MLMLSDFCSPKERRELWSFGCGFAGCDASNEWSFGVTDKNWSIKVPVGSTLDFPR